MHLCGWYVGLPEMGPPVTTITVKTHLLWRTVGLVQFPLLACGGPDTLSHLLCTVHCSYEIQQSLLIFTLLRRCHTIGKLGQPCQPIKSADNDLTALRFFSLFQFFF